MRRRLSAVVVVQVVLLSTFLHSPEALANGPIVGRFEDKDGAPGVEVKDHQSGSGKKHKRDSHYSGVVDVEKVPPKPDPELRRDMTSQEFLATLCTNQDFFFPEPNTYIPACGPLPPVVENTNPAQQQAAAEAYARDYLQRVALDKPKPTISAQNGGICGVEHSVDLHMRTERRFQDSSAPYGALNIHAYAVNTIDWGDGSVNRYTTSGGQWPNMSISHFWTDRGFYNINVTSVWTAHWSMGSYSGVLSGLSATGSIDNFRVWEAQAMLVK